jgi:hypothetical protein
VPQSFQPIALQRLRSAVIDTASIRISEPQC